ncbi:MAG: VWA domain-containing protein [Acidobacteriaceae bacterium]|nr:VWA domain-containing protein [Acidobacteriaceae bacterium]MBV9293999.1 VWA domain-containing protein [Acidobacteriaceae bacterium]MBV9764639.1 VWA domain-containing protein [Acidobacteriaceae bacterium]
MNNSRLSRRDLIRSSIAAVSTLPLWAKQEPTFSANVKVVNILATVRDKKGQIIRNLSKEDFTLLEEGKPQGIRYFSRESDLPLTLGLLVDTSLSQTRVLEDERGASYRFLEQVLREDRDKAFIVQFDQVILIRQDLTSSRKDLESALEVVDSPDPRKLGGGGGGTLLYDAVRKISIQVMKKLQGRKAFIVLSDGVDVGSAITLTDAIETAERADTLVYSILFSDPNAYGAFSLGSPGKGVLERLSRETGGRFFEVAKKQSIGQIFESIEEELRSQYSLGFVSDEPVTASGFRKIRLTVKQKGLLVQARDRYYAEL